MQIKERVDNILKEYEADGFIHKPVFLGIDNNCFLYKYYFGNYEPLIRKPMVHYTSFREIKEDILQVEFNPERRGSVSASYYLGEGTSPSSGQNYSHAFKKGYYSLDGDPEAFHKIEEDFCVIIEESKLHIAMTLPEIIERFDPDIEGIESIEPSEEKQKARFDATKEKYHKKMKVVSSNSEEATDYNPLEIFADHYAQSELLIPEVVRSLKAIKNILDKEKVNYWTAEKQKELIASLEERFDREGILYKFIPNSRS